MELKVLRKSFLEYFAKNGHTIMPASPLVPHNDPTLMFTNSGMVQFKECFTGLKKPEHSKVTTVQKCVRAGGKHNDLENVGYTARHHTFFEMLGNFSFGAYFKEEAITLAWNLLVTELKLPRDRLYVTVYHQDEQAADIWKKVAGLNDERIIRIHTNDNFWQMGDTGPCGPCSEIFYDHGSTIEGGLPGTPQQDGDRYVEIWNLVFMQFEQTLGGEMSPLPKPCIDTGAGLERLAAVLQGKHHNYEIDLFQHIIDTSQELSGQKGHLASHRVIADHLRASAFLIADGVMPSNEGRGYVLRRIMRRAMRHISQLGCKETMLYRLLPVLVNEMGEAYPELKRAEAMIATTLRFEEERFKETLDSGLKILASATNNISSGHTLPGEVAFKLYDTYGFPLDLTRDILRAREIGVDEKGFDTAMAQQRQRARAAWTGSGARADDGIWFALQDQVQSTDFWGYATTQASATVTGIIQNGQIVNEASEGEAIVVLDGTPFYGESGGQVGDTGIIISYDQHAKPITHSVHDTSKHLGDIFGHHITLNSPLKVGETVEAQVDVARRCKIMANHSATHLLHKALQIILGPHVVQKGSLVAADRLRFDFSHIQAISPEQKQQIENIVNGWIIANDHVSTELLATEQALAKGAMGLFGEKYGDQVRVVSMGESLELCGGTHVERTGDIGLLKLLSEEAVSAGVRRIEAATGLAAIEYVNKLLGEATATAAALHCGVGEMKTRVDTLLHDKRNLEKEVEALRLKNAVASVVAADANGMLLHHFTDIKSGALRHIATEIINQHQAKIVMVTCSEEQKLSVVLAIAPYAQGEYNAASLLAAVTDAFGGKGGGNAAIAQAGNIAAGNAEALFSLIRTLVV